MSPYTIMVCPHDTVRSSSGWYRLVAYVSERLNLELHFDLALDFGEFHARLGKADLVFGNPSDSLKLLDKGFSPLVQPQDHFDEAILVMSADAPAATTPQTLAGAAVATVTSAAPTHLALHNLKAQGISPGELKNYDSWLGVVRGIWNGEAPFGILYRDAYEELSPQGRAMVQVMSRTDVKKLFHMLCAAPNLAAEAPKLTALLVGMKGDAVGREVLQDLGFTAWKMVDPADVATMRALLNS